ncbi:uncharacterized protein LOC135936512 isoform X2 [Cloeon dipterum]|uniref:uncharacterized protein LOC135936512 isoform X2 n=1 Tax=Cloeon dipterum TaxID=197152 RepID=UPI00321FC78E
MGQGCVSKKESMKLGPEPNQGRYTATFAPPLANGNVGNNGHVMGEGFVKSGRKKGVLHLNEPTEEEEKAAKAAEEARKKEEHLRKLEEEKRLKAEEERKQREQEEMRKTEKAKKKQEEEERKRRLEEEKRQKEEEEARLREEAKRRQEEQKRLEDESREQSIILEQEIKERRKSDDSRTNTYRYLQLKNTYLNDFDIFLINNTLMSVEFGNERELFEKARSVCSLDFREGEMNTRMSSTGHLKKAVAPDAIHEYLSQTIRFAPEDTAYVSHGVPLRPIRVMISHEDILVEQQMTRKMSPSRNVRLYVESASKEMDRTNKSGYVRLLSMDSEKILKTRSQENLVEDPQEGYPSFSDPEDRGGVPASVRVPEANSNSSDSDDQFDGTLPKLSYSSVGTASGWSSRRPSYPNVSGSTSSSGYSYSTIATLRRQLLLAQRRQQLEGPTFKVGLPSNCFVGKMVRSYNANSDQLFKTKYYLRSSSFMDYFSAVFADMLAMDLGFLPVWIDEATVCGATISIKTTQQDSNSPKTSQKLAKLEIIPAVSCKPENWPAGAVEFIWRKRIEAFNQLTQTRYSWPSTEMVREATTKGYHLIPVGYIPKKVSNPWFDLEWKIEFPEAERYLETCLSDTQLRCYIFCLLLFQVFFKRDDTVTEDHLRHVIFWQAENFTTAWANYEMHNNIRAVYDSLYENLSNMELPNYFIRTRNEFQQIQQKQLQGVQNAVNKFRQNPLGHIIAALRRLQIQGKDLRLNLSRLVELIMSQSTIMMINPALGTMTNKPLPKKRGSEDSDGLWKNIRKIDMVTMDQKKAWKIKYMESTMQQRRQIEQQLRRESETPKTKQQLEVIVPKDAVFDSPRRLLILEFFIEHFVGMVANPMTGRVSSDVLQHAKNLLCLYTEQPSHDSERTLEWRALLKRVRTAPSSQARQRPQMQLPTEGANENWTMQSVAVDTWRGRRLMMDAPPTMVFHRADEESEVVSTDGTDL